MDYRDGPMALNEQGQVVGGYNDHAFLWTDGKRTDLGALPVREGDGLDDTLSVAYGINNRGVVVGSSGSFRPVFMSGLQVARGFITEKSGMHQLTSDGSFFPYAINDAGQIAGLYAYRGFFYAGGKLIPLGTLSHVPNGNRSTARSLNAQGQVVGWSTVGSLPVAKFGQLASHAFLWQRHGKSGRMHDLGTLPGWVNSYAYGINDRGEVIGSVSGETSYTGGVDPSVHTAAFLWREGKIVNLGTLSGSKNSTAFGINDSTQIVGTSDNRAFVWRQGKMLDLNACLPSGSGWTLEEARTINNKGQIVGSGKMNGQEHMFLLTPTAD